MSNVQLANNYNFSLECLKKDINNIFTVYNNKSTIVANKRINQIFHELEQAFNQNNYTNVNVVGTIQARRLLHIILLIKQLYRVLWLATKNNHVTICKEEIVTIIADSFNVLRACATDKNSSMFVEDFIKLAKGIDDYSISIRS